jgi:hypothetical protein
MIYQNVMRYSPNERVFRVGRLVWDTGNVGDGKGYSTKLSLALTPTLFRWYREPGHVWTLVLFGIRVQRTTAWGGRYA